MIAQINALAVSVKLFLRNDFESDIHDIWSHEIGPYLRNRWSNLLGKVPNAVERPSREQREWIRKRQNGKRNQKSDEIYNFLHKTSRIGIFVSRRAGTLELLWWRRKWHLKMLLDDGTERVREEVLWLRWWWCALDFFCGIEDGECLRWTIFFGGK